jgi:hypothetical protein
LPPSPSKELAALRPSSSASSLSPTKPKAANLDPLAHQGHQPTKRSHRKVTQLLQARPPSVFNRRGKDGDPILDCIHDYYTIAGDTMNNDMQLLKSPPKRLPNFGQPVEPRKPVKVPILS